MNLTRTGAATAPIGTAGGLWEQVWTRLSAHLEQGRRGVEADAEGARVLRVMGPLDRRLAPQVKAQARLFTSGDATSWSIDLSAVTSWDGDGLAALVHALDLSDIAGKTLYLLDPNPRLRDTLERSQLHHLFPILAREELGR